MSNNNYSSVEPNRRRPKIECTKSERIRTIFPPEVSETAAPVFGVVANCAKLNAREAPKADAEILGVLLSGTTLKIDMDSSTDEFYHVCTAAGFEAYCRKEFVEICQ